MTNEGFETCSISADRPARTSTARASTTRRRSSRSSAASEYAVARDRTESSSRSTSTRSRRSTPRRSPYRLLFSFRDAEPERRVADELSRRYPSAHVVASHEVAPEFREYERASTTAVDAYLGPVLSRYLRALGGACAGAGLPEPLVMRSSGGLATLEEAAAHAAFALLSGPAAGPGAARLAALAGFENALSFDMGGTSTDVCAIADGEARREHERLVDGLPIRLPTSPCTPSARAEVHRPAGRGRRASRGPESAGADPGPACYGRGGVHATVTDANLLLGRLPPTLPGGIELDTAAAERALGAVDPGGVVDVVNAEMVRALRVVSVEQGSTRATSRSSHSAAPARCTPARSLRSWACGPCSSRPQRVSSPLSAWSPRTNGATQCGRTSPPSPTQASCPTTERRTFATPASRSSPRPTRPDLAERFHDAHEARYGYADRERSIELVAVRTAEIARRRP